MQLKLNSELKLPGGGNVYRVEKIVGRHLLLRCVWFSHKEDLGDQIFCTHEEQEIWVAMFHAQHYHLINKET